MIKYVSIVFFAFLFSIKIVVAQAFISFPFSGHNEDAVFNLGFQYNYVNQNFQLKLKDNWSQIYEELDTDLSDITYLGELKGIHNKSSHGFSIGIPADMQLNDRLSFTGSVIFSILNSHQISYVPMNSELETIDRKSKHVLQDPNGDNFNTFEFPFALKLKSDEKKLFHSNSKFRVYLVGGIRFVRWSGSITKYRELTEEQRRNRPYAEGLVYKPEYMSWDVGAGLDFYLTHFKVSPEIRFNQSFTNSLNNRHILALNNKYMAPLDRGLVRNVYFSLIFQ